MKARFHPFSDLLLERYVAGELDAGEARRVEEAAAANPALDHHLKERRAEREAFKHRLKTLTLPEKPPSTRAGWWVLAGSLAAAAAVALVLVNDPTGDRPVGGGIGLRGDARVTVAVAVQRGGEVFAYREGVVLQPEDRIRLTVKVALPGHLTVVGRDVKNTPQVLYDSLSVSGETTLPDSLELDETPGSEELYFFFSPRPVAAADALERVRRGQVESAVVLKLVKGLP